jgi:branched-subunit amino acid transport protein AzlD
LVVLGAAIAAGAGASALIAETGAPALQTGAIVVRLLVAVPLAFLSVMVPAGIYLELTRAEISADIFA